MSAGGWPYLLFTAALAATLVGIIVHYFRPKRRDRVESPKHRMLDDERDGRGTTADDRR